MAKQFTLGKAERLKSRKTLDLLFKEGKRFNMQSFRISYMTGNVNEKPGIQFGVGVSARNFKKAVDRNRVKRLMREAFRLQKIGLVNSCIEQNLHLDLFVIYTAKELPVYALVYEQMALILKKLAKLINENGPSNT